MMPILDDVPQEMQAFVGQLDEAMRRLLDVIMEYRTCQPDIVAEPIAATYSLRYCDTREKWRSTVMRLPSVADA